MAFYRMRRRRVEVIKDMSPDVLNSVYSVKAGDQGVMDDTGYTFYFTPEMVKEYLRFFRSL